MSVGKRLGVEGVGARDGFLKAQKEMLGACVWALGRCQKGSTHRGGPRALQLVAERALGLQGQVGCVLRSLWGLTPSRGSAHSCCPFLDLTSVTYLRDTTTIEGSFAPLVRSPRSP